MKKIAILSLLIITFFGCTQKKSDVKTETDEPIVIINKTAMVYTSAHSTNLKLTLTDTLQFIDFEQPLETEAAIVIDPTKQFQTFLGIGASLTDASAETFYKLSKE
ncbi:MAG: glycosyl hydrolase, partial [Gillisia sp.]|nr:glycosyl hydrolase [Gillisia sp.]